MSKSSFSAIDEADDFYNEAKDDWVGLWEIVAAAKENFSMQEEVREGSFEIVRLLIARGLRAGNLTKEGGFVPWPQQDPDTVIDRIRREWTELGGDPTINDIAWFDMPR